MNTYRSVLGKTVPSVLGTALGLRPRSVLKTSDTVFPIRTSRPANNIYLFFFLAGQNIARLEGVLLKEEKRSMVIVINRDVTPYT